MQDVKNTKRQTLTDLNRGGRICLRAGCFVLMEADGLCSFFCVFLGRADEINFHPPPPRLPIARKHSLNSDVGEAFGTARPQNSRAQNHTSWIKLVVISSHSFLFFSPCCVFTVVKVRKKYRGRETVRRGSEHWWSLTEARNKPC